MPLKTIVKVGNISNLSDARYSAGMGVDMLGFNVLEGQENFLTPKAFQEIRGWVAGPATVAEVYGFSDDTDFASIIEHYAPDYFEFGAEQLITFPYPSSIPVIVSVSESSFNQYKNKIDFSRSSIVYVHVHESDSSLDFIKQLALEYPVLVSVSNTEVQTMLNNTSVLGFALNGSKEVKPGLKDYDHLADVLEQLDVD